MKNEVIKSVYPDSEILSEKWVSDGKTVEYQIRLRTKMTKEDLRALTAKVLFEHEADFRDIIITGVKDYNKIRILM